MSRSRLVDLAVIIHVETEMAFGIKETEDGPLIWMPKSQCEVDDRKPDGSATLTCPEWIANEKGLI